MKIVIDTREKKPWNFENHHQIFKKLETGDYSLSRFEDKIAIERKSLDDYIQSVVRNRHRFSKTLKRLSKLKYSCIVVESSFNQMMLGIYHSNVNPKFLKLQTNTIKTIFGLPIYFCEDRQDAKRIALTWLEEFANA